MDSLSQIVLGAAVGELMLGRKIGNKAQLIGAIGGTIPDLDILLNTVFTDPIDQIHIHRGYSHSMFVHLILALPFAWITWRWLKEKVSFREMYMTWYLILFTHAILDCFTTYGTQLFLPFTDYLVGFNNISVIDPLWTLPFMVTLLVCLFLRRNNPKRLRWAKAGVYYAGLYMLISFANKWVVHNHFTHDLAGKGIICSSLSTSPTMLNNMLWAGIAHAGDSIYLGEYSILQRTDNVKWIAYPVNESLLKSYSSSPELETLKWFSQGHYFIEEDGDELHFFLAKWGRMNLAECDARKAFVFHWKLTRDGSRIVAMPVEPEWEEGTLSKAITQLWNRIFDPI
jgi:inner membrane protein